MKPSGVSVALCVMASCVVLFCAVEFFVFSLRLQANGAQGSQKETMVNMNGASDRACLGGVLRCCYLLASGLVMESGGPMHEQTQQIAMYLLQSERHDDESLQTSVFNVDIHV